MTSGRTQACTETKVSAPAIHSFDGFPIRKYKHPKTVFPSKAFEEICIISFIRVSYGVRID